MLVYDDALTFMARMAQDNSATARTFLVMCYNTGYRTLLTEFGRQVLESEATIDLVAGQRSYQVPPDCIRPKTLELIDATTLNPIYEKADDKTWTYLKSGNIQGKPIHYHYRPRFGLGGGVVELDPIPSSSDYDMRMIYETRDKDLGVAAYNTGTVSLTNDDATVTGSGTTFTAAMVGRYFIPTTAGTDALPYRIITFTDATHIELENNYAGATVAGASYKIVEIPNLPEDMHILPCFFALEQWWSSKGSTAKTKEFMDKWVIGMARAKRTHATVTRDNIVNQMPMSLPFEEYPWTFPQNVSS